MRILRYNEMYVDKNGDVWEDKDHTKRVIQYVEPNRKDIYFLIYETEVDEYYHSFGLVVYSKKDNLPIEEEMIDLFPKVVVDSFNYNDIKELGPGDFAVPYGWTLEELKKYLNTLGYKDIRYQEKQREF